MPFISIGFELWCKAIFYFNRRNFSKINFSIY